MVFSPESFRGEAPRLFGFLTLRRKELCTSMTEKKSAAKQRVDVADVKHEILTSTLGLIKPWQTEDGRIYFDIKDGEIVRSFTFAKSRGDFYDWFVSRCVDRHEYFPSGEFLNAAMAYFNNWARTKAPKLKDFVRVGGSVDDVYLDIADNSNYCWKITKDEITKVTHPSGFKFLRGAGMLPLVHPNLDTPASELPKLLSHYIEADAATLALICAWLVGALRPNGPYPVLTVSGEQGSGKSSLLRLLRRIIDPHALDMRVPPDDQRDLQAIVRNSFILAFDNVSFLSNKMSDSLCVISTGTGAQGGRALYTNAEESAVRVCRPVMLNGIPDVIERGDLVDRSIHIHLPRIDPSRRRDDYEFWQMFDAEHGKFLGALMNAVRSAIGRYPDVYLPEKPRMSAFAVWAVAAEKALGIENGLIIREYVKNRQAADAGMIEFNGIGSTVMRMLEAKRTFSGTYEELIAQLELYKGPLEHLPRSSHGVASELRRVKPSLEKLGIKFYTNGRITDGKKGKGRTRIELAWPQEDDIVIGGEVG